jgi:hypothetical protein
MTEDEKKITPEDAKAMFMCGSHENKASKCILDREAGIEYIAEHNISVRYSKELNDGTPRRIWTMHDPNKELCGTLITARGDLGSRNKENFMQDIFDFMEIRIGRSDFANAETTYSPRTAYYIQKENNNIAG